MATTTTTTAASNDTDYQLVSDLGAILFGAATLYSLVWMLRWRLWHRTHALILGFMLFVVYLDIAVRANFDIQNGIRLYYVRWIVYAFQKPWTNYLRCRLLGVESTATMLSVIAEFAVFAILAGGEFSPGYKAFPLVLAIILSVVSFVMCWIGAKVGRSRMHKKFDNDLGTVIVQETEDLDGDMETVIYTKLPETSVIPFFSLFDLFIILIGQIPELAIWVLWWVGPEFLQIQDALYPVFWILLSIDIYVYITISFLFPARNDYSALQVYTTNLNSNASDKDEDNDDTSNTDAASNSNLRYPYTN